MNNSTRVKNILTCVTIKKDDCGVLGNRERSNECRAG